MQWIPLVEAHPSLIQRDLGSLGLTEKTLDMYWTFDGQVTAVLLLLLPEVPYLAHEDLLPAMNASI